MTKRHTVHLMLDEEAWARAQQSAEANGLTTVTGLCSWLLHREIEYEPVKAPRKPRSDRKVTKKKASAKRTKKV